MMRIFKLAGLIAAVIIVFYTARAVFAVSKTKEIVSVYDLKQAIAVLIEDVNRLKMQIQVLTTDVLSLKKEISSLSLKVQTNRPYVYTFIRCL